MNLKTIHSISIYILSVGMTTQAASMEHKVGDKSAQDLFADPKVQALAVAACNGDAAGIARALASDIPVDATGLDQSTPLMWALSCDNADGMEALLKAGADPNKSNGRFTPVYAAATRHKTEPLKLLLKYGGVANTEDSKTRKTALQEALELGIHGIGWDNYYALLQKADINTADEMGYTITKDAAALGQFDKVFELLERGYQYDLTDLGYTVQTRQVDPNHVQAQWQKKVRALLESKGVKFPVLPRNQRGKSNG
jgi:hypothetical protein